MAGRNLNVHDGVTNTLFFLANSFNHGILFRINLQLVQKLVFYYLYLILYTHHVYQEV